MDILELVRAGLLDPEDRVPQSDADLEAEWGNYAVAEDPLVDSGNSEQLRKDVLAQIASRYFPVPIGNHDPAFLEGYARRALERELRGRFGDEAMEGAFAEDGSFVGRPEIAWDNPIAREIARAEYRDGGMDALIALDPRYEAYRGYDAGSKTAGFDNHLLPPGYADYLRAERDYDILREMQKTGPDSNLTDLRLSAALEGDVPFSRYANLGTEYYPRFYGQGVGNAFASGESPVANTLSALEVVPNTFRYMADEPDTPARRALTDPLMGGGLTNLALRIPGAAEKAIRELGRVIQNRSSGRELPIADRPVGGEESAKQSGVSAEADRRDAAVPPSGTDFMRNVTGFDTPPVVGDLADIAVSYLDGTPFIGGGFDLVTSGLRAANEGKSAARAIGGILKTDAAVEGAVGSGINSMLPPLPRTWGDYLFKPETERQAAAPEAVDKAARASEPEFNYGSTLDAKNFVHGDPARTGTSRSLPAHLRKEAYQAGPGEIRQMLKEKKRRENDSWTSRVDFMGG